MEHTPLFTHGVNAADMFISRLQASLHLTLDRLENETEGEKLREDGRGPGPGPDEVQLLDPMVEEES